MPLRRESRGQLPARAAVLAALAAALWGSVCALRYGMPLSAIMGKTYFLLVGGLAVSLALVLLAFFKAQPHWGTVRGALYAFAAGTIAYMAFLQPVRTVVAALHFAVCAGAFALLLCFLPGGRWRRAADLLLAVLLVLVLGGEIALRVVSRSSHSPLLAPTDESAVEMLKRYRLEPGSMRMHFPHNSRGDYDVEVQPGEAFAVVIGDSFSAGVVPYPWHYTSVAEAALGGAQVYNMGAPAIGPEEYLHLIRTEALLMRPAVIVVAFFIGNDVNAVRPKVARAGMLGWLDPERWMLGLVARRLSRLKEEGGPQAGSAGSEKMVTDLEELARLHPQVRDPSLEIPSMTRGGFVRIETTRAREVCGPLTDNFELALDRLRDMREACKDVPFAVLLIPDEFQVEDELWALVCANAPGESFDRDQPQRILRAGLGAEGIPYLDLLPVFRAHPPLPDGRHHLYHLQDTHLNALGSDVAGKALGEFLRAWKP